MNEDSNYLTRFWSTTDQKLNIEFQISTDPTIHPAVVANISFPQYPETVFEVILEQFESSLNFNFRDLVGNFVRGMMKGVAFDDCLGPDELGLWSDIYYGRNELSHFEGIMVVVPAIARPGCVPAPLDPPRPADPLPTRPTHFVVDEVVDLFPYLYMYPWPKTRPLDKAQHFVLFDPTIISPPQADFYKQLSQLKAKGSADAREQMQLLATAFINGDGIWKGLFVDDPVRLSWPIADLAAPVEALRNLPRPEASEIAAVLDALARIKHHQGLALLKSKAYLEGIARVWNSYFALIIDQGFAEADMRGLIMTLIGANLLKALILSDPQPAAVLQTVRAHILLPSAVFPLPPEAKSKTKTGDTIEPYAIGDLQMARRRFLRYQPGEIARVVNVLPGERRTMRTRELNRIKQSTRDSRNEKSSSENQTGDTQSSLREEVRRVLAANTYTTAYNNFQTTYGPPTVADLTGSWSVDSKPNAPSKEDVTRFAREILDNAVRGLTLKMDSLRAYASLDETEETSDSTIDNSDGSAPLTGVYRWLNKIYQVYVVNTGTRLVIEFIVERPAAFYQARQDAVRSGSRPPPKHSKMPTGATPVGAPTDITPANYLALASHFGARDVPPPPPATWSVSAIMQNGSETSINLPQGYAAAKAYVAFAASQSGGVEGVIGRNAFTLSGSSGTKQLDLNGEIESIAAAVLSMDHGSPPAVGEVALSLEIECRLTPQRLEQWQLQVYRALRGDPESPPIFEPGQPPPNQDEKSGDRYSAIERREIKRAAMRALFQRHRKLAGAALSPPGGKPATDIINEPRFADFFQRALEWREMSYQLYESGPYSGLSDPYEDSYENQFAALDRFMMFLDASAARILVPVHPSSNLAVLYYLSGGGFWTMNNDLAPVNPADEDAANELIKAFSPDRLTDLPGPTGETWEIVMPTSLQVMQAGSPFESRDETCPNEGDE